MTRARANDAATPSFSAGNHVERGMETGFDASTPINQNALIDGFAVDA